MNAQTMAAANVAARGYRDGWTAEQFVARQLCKLTEELAEGAFNALLDPYSEWLSALRDAGLLARKAFDRRGIWDGASIGDADALRAELTDMMVVLLAAADALGFYILPAAIEKSSQDVARGVR